jgi:hypothetical protein
MTARRALINAGYIVAKPETEEAFDVVFRDPVNLQWYSAQIKTVRVREDREGSPLVVYAKKGNGEPYTLSDADYIIGVQGDKAYIFANRGIGEYWTNDPANRWRELPSVYERDAVERPVVDGGIASCPA